MFWVCLYDRVVVSGLWGHSGPATRSLMRIYYRKVFLKTRRKSNDVVVSDFVQRLKAKSHSGTRQHALFVRSSPNSAVLEWIA